VSLDEPASSAQTGGTFTSQPIEVDTEPGDVVEIWFGVFVDHAFVWTKKQVTVAAAAPTVTSLTLTPTPPPPQPGQAGDRPDDRCLGWPFDSMAVGRQRGLPRIGSECRSDRRDVHQSTERSAAT